MKLFPGDVHKTYDSEQRYKKIILLYHEHAKLLFHVYLFNGLEHVLMHT